MKMCLRPTICTTILKFNNKLSAKQNCCRYNWQYESSASHRFIHRLYSFCLLKCQQCCVINCVFILIPKVREQERYIALQVRREVQERKERELQSLATALQEEWQKQRGERIQTLEKLYQENLRDVGQGQRSAKENVSGKRAQSVLLKSSVAFMSSAVNNICYIGYITCEDRLGDIVSHSLNMYNTYLLSKPGFWGG